MTAKLSVCRWLEIRRSALVLGLAVGVLALAGCIHRTRGLPVPSPSRVTPGVTTKSQVYELYGVPTDVFLFQDGSSILLYQQEQVRGRGLGVGFGVFPIVSFSHQHSGVDTLHVVVGPDRVVKKVGVWEQSDLATYRLSPFGQ